MSQKKVDHYKEQKANRKELIKKEKRILMIEKIIGTLVVAAVACWVVFSVYSKATAPSADQETEVVETVINTNALNDYLSTVSDTYAE